MLLKKPEDLLDFSIHYDDECVFILRVPIQIPLTIAVHVARCERSFSKLELILFHLRALLGQLRLTDLSLFSNEREIIEETDLETLVGRFEAERSFVLLEFVEQRSPCRSSAR